MRRNAGKRIDLYNLIKMYKQLDGDAGKVNVGYIKSLDLEDVEEEIRRVRDFIADIQHFEPLIREQERMEALEAQEQRINLDALQLQDLEDRLSGIRTRRASDVIYELEGRIARLERQATTKSEAYEALRGFMSQNQTDTRLIIELGGYLQTLKDGGDLSERDLKNIRKMMHRNNASDLADSFRSKPTGRQPSPRVVQQPPAPRPRPVQQRRPRPTPKVEEQLPTAQEVYDFMRRSRTIEGGTMEGISLREEDWCWHLWFEPSWRWRIDHYGNDGEGWDEEAWWDDWAGPLTKEIEQLLFKKYPKFKKLKEGYNEDFEFYVGEKGHISVLLSKKKFKRS